MENFNNNTEQNNFEQNAEKTNSGVQYYNGGQFYDNPNSMYNSTSNGVYVKPKKGMPGWLKAILIIVAVILVIVFLTTSCDNAVNKISSTLGSDTSNEVVTDFGHDYIGVIYVNGTITEGVDGGYNHQYLLNAIDSMMYDDDNKGIIMYVNTPGGSVFASDELYFKIKKYQETTKRPVYSSMQSMAASGGYYVSAPCDKIIANRNCWTGSIGVTLGTMYDASELLTKLGLKTTTITSGANKAMGSNTEEMSGDQRQIFQAMVDEAYEQFTGIVAEGRNMDIQEVKKLADGRIYTAKQALDNGLIDKIGTFEEAVADMQQTYGLQSCSIENLVPPESNSLRDILGIITDGNNGGFADIDSIQALIDMNGKMQLYYMAEVQK